MVVVAVVAVFMAFLVAGEVLLMGGG